MPRTLTPAKISPPQLERTLLRERLFARIDAAETARIVWISAQAGAGKTVLGASYVSARARSSLWYQIDEGDADPAGFFHYLGLAAQSAGPKRYASLPALTPEYAKGLPTFTRRFFEQLASRLRPPAWLVLDDFQALGADSPLHELLTHGAAGMPGGMRLMILSRGGPVPAFARMQASGELVALDWQALRFTEEESAQLINLCSDGAPPGQAETKAIQASAEGWAAGLILLTKQGPAPGRAAPDQDGTGDEVVFNYFAAEVLRKEPPDVRAFLMATAVPQAFSAQIALALTGDARAPEIMERIGSGNYFAYRLGASTTRMRYHALFREFLLALGRRELGDAAIAALQRRAATLLAEAGDVEEAAALQIAGKDWPALHALILTHAEQLVVSGRQETLAAWIQALPESERGGDPWLRYWEGTALLAAHPLRARACFERAFKRFDRLDDPAGLYLSWAAVVETYALLWDDVHPLDHWARVLMRIQRRHPTLPSPLIEARVAGCAVLVVQWRPRHQRRLADWIAKASGALRGEIPGHLKIQLCYGLMTYHSWLGRGRDMRAIFEIMSPQVGQMTLSPLLRIEWGFTSGLYHFYHGEVDHWARVLGEALHIAEHSGVHMFDPLLLAFKAQADMYSEGLADGREMIVRAQRLKNPDRPMLDAMIAYSSGKIAFYAGEHGRTLEHSAEALRLTQLTGADVPEAITRVGIAIALISTGRYAEALPEALWVRRKLAGLDSDLTVVTNQLVLAEIHIALGEERKGRRLLRGALDRTASDSGACLERWKPTWPSALMGYALEHGIETGAARELIRRYRLEPPEEALLAEGWPWALKVHTLGGLVLTADEGFPTPQVGGKPLELLGLLLSAGREGLVAERIQDLLWPDAEGAGSEKAFAIALHRLREQVGREALVLRDRRLRLDDKKCWVDAWACERYWQAAYSGDDKATHARSGPLTKALELYRGEFLAGESESPWLLGARVRIHDRFLQELAELSDQLTGTGDMTAAIRHLKRGLVIDPLAEPLYQRLMTSQARLGRHADVKLTYRRCTRMLHAHLEVGPSAETQAVYRTLTGST